MLASLLGIILKHPEVSMDSRVGSSSLLKQVFSDALITAGIIIARIIKRGKKSRNQYRIPFAAVVKTRETGREGGREGRRSERAREGGRGWMEAGREGGMKGGREVRGWGGDV